ncbi:MAG: DUF302 domain-containing protein [Cyclobacteriaceae bacterium]|nr:DUF302 domain-containing protein [Cyclobacteriaceae bacterium]
MYYLNKTTSLAFSVAEEQIRAALKEVGFGILTEIDMQGTLKAKIDKDIQPYKILGACNPKFAYQAVQEEEKIGIMLPCNVTIIDNQNGTVDISIMNPEVALKVVENDNIAPFAAEVKSLLESALSNVE